MTYGRLACRIAATEARRWRAERAAAAIEESGKPSDINHVATDQAADHAVVDQTGDDRDANERAMAEVAGLNLSELASQLDFVAESEPEITIVIPVFNKTAFTLNCLQSLQRLKTRRRFEILIVDDRSAEAETGLLRHIPGVRYHQNEENVGFLQSCNRASELARGDFLIFLNNDTRVAPDWLDTMRSTFDQHRDVGIVGSKLLYPDGSLQEAGGVIWRDASGWNYGRGHDPGHPRYNYVRDVDYVSGASLMVRAGLFAEVGRFDERFAPAYYEDTDLAFTVRQRGYRVLYQPAAEVIHYEGVSSGTSTESGVKRHQVTNAATFERKWRTELANHMVDGGDQPPMAADRATVGHVLIVDACTPTPNKDSGSLDMVNLIQIILNLGYRVHYANAYEELIDWGPRTRVLQQMGVETLTSPYYSSVDSYLEENQISFDHVILSRYLMAQDHMGVVRQHCPDAQVIFNTVDLHGLREVREAALIGDAELADQARFTEHCELGVVEVADVTIVLSEIERSHLNKLGHNQVMVLPLIRQPKGRAATSFEERSGVVFIGGSAHPPNRDALDWLLFDIWPQVRRRCNELAIAPFTLKIIGAELPTHVWNEAADDVVIYGHMDNIDPVFAQSRLSVAPLRYGAGLKGKVATSLDFGLPVVGTEIAFEGMPEPSLVIDELSGPSSLAGSVSDLVIEVDTVAEFADRIVETHSDGAQWEWRSLAGVEYVKQQYSVDALTARVGQLLGRGSPASVPNRSSSTSGAQNPETRPGQPASA